jgi:hypothetical protein
MNKFCGNPRSATLVALAGLAMACGSREPRHAETPCSNKPVSVVLGFERAQVGANELPIAILCDPRSPHPAPQVTQVAVRFEPQPKSAADGPVPGEVVYRPGARVLESAQGALHFDDIVKVVLDRAGRWAMQIELKAPWNADEAKTVVAFPVDSTAAGSPNAQPP